MRTWSSIVRHYGVISALAIVAAGVVGVRPSMAQTDDRDEVKRVSQSASSQSYNVAGYRVLFKPYVETEGGHDSNPDNQFNKTGSSFVKLETGLKLTAEKPDEYYGLTLKGRYIDFNDLPVDIQQRTDFKVALDTSYNLSASETIKSGSYFLRDLISLERADIYHSFAEYTYVQPGYRIKLQAKSHVESNFDDQKQGVLAFDEFSVTRARAFDFARSDVQANFLTNTTSLFQPFIILDAALLDYYNQDSGVSIDRNAQEAFAIPGVRFQFDKTFRVDLGYRYNDRNFDDRTIGRFTSNFVDVNVYWQPVDAFKLTAVVERFMQEPSSSFGLADDVRSYGLTADWDIADRWSLAATGYYDLEDAIGDNIKNRKITTTASLTFEPNDNTELFLSGLAKWVDEDVSGDSYTRFKIGSGVRLKY